jgi:hypothetical protein
VLLLIIKIIKKILIFFGVNPTPAMFATFGLISVTEKGKTIVTEQNTKFENRLTQIAYLFQVIFQVCTSIALEITLIIAKLNALVEDEILLEMIYDKPFDPSKVQMEQKIEGFSVNISKLRENIYAKIIKEI